MRSLMSTAVDYARVVHVGLVVAALLAVVTLTGGAPQSPPPPPGIRLTFPDKAASAPVASVSAGKARKVRPGTVRTSTGRLARLNADGCLWLTYGEVEALPRSVTRSPEFDPRDGEWLCPN